MAGAGGCAGACAVALRRSAAFSFANLQGKGWSVLCKSSPILSGRILSFSSLPRHTTSIPAFNDKPPAEEPFSAHWKFECVLTPPSHLSHASLRGPSFASCCFRFHVPSFSSHLIAGYESYALLKRVRVSIVLADAFAILDCHQRAPSRQTAHLGLLYYIALIPDTHFDCCFPSNSQTLEALSSCTTTTLGTVQVALPSSRSDWQQMHSCYRRQV